MAINGDPNASLASSIVFAAYGAVFAVLAAYLFRPFFGSPERSRHEDRNLSEPRDTLSRVQQGGTQ
jgi:hypothetical protein